jgi:hypothetical protein
MFDLMEIATAEMERKHEADLQYEHDQEVRREHERQLLIDRMKTYNLIWQFFHGDDAHEKPRPRSR